MTFKEFIKENRDAIDRYIMRSIGRCDIKLNNEERRQWVLNDYDLYKWARRSGVRI